MASNLFVKKSMEQQSPSFLYRAASMTGKDFQVIQEYVQRFSGIKVEPNKKVLLESRLGQRVRILNFDSYANYLQYVFSSQGTEERKNMMDMLTTNKTFFFREDAHFDALTNMVLPELTRQTSHVKLWSAGVSTGQEMYTLGMVMSEYNRQQVQPLGYKITGTDLSYRVLQRAYNAVYTQEECDSIPAPLLQRYFLRKKDRATCFYKVAPELRNYMQFRQHNLMDSHYNFPESPFHVIFCRNVLIYFPPDIQKAVIKKLLDVLQPNGWLFLGHAESLMYIDLPVEQILPSLYRKIA